MKNGLLKMRVCPAVSSVASGTMYERCNPVVGSRYGRLLKFGGVRNRPSSRPFTLLPRCVRWPRVSANEKLPPTVRPSVRWCEALSRVVARSKIVVRSDEHAFVVVVVPRQIERRALVAAGHAERVVENVPRVERLVRMIERRRPVSGGAPASRDGGCRAPLALPVLPLQRIDLRDLVVRSRSCGASSASVPSAALRRDEDDAIRRARAVDRRRRRSLENLDALDVGGIEIHHPVRRRRSLELAADVLSADARRRTGVDRIEVRRRERACCSSARRRR